MVKRFRRMSDSDINTIVADLDRWALGELGSKLTWAVLEERFGFSRQSLQATVKWFTEFGHLNRGDMLTSEQHRCHNEKKKFQRRV
ncbi:hypothetical protein IPCEC42_45130 [Escherichia coli]|nr:hypothetical protein IPCEC42_45130 [Escherichia coli]BDR51390.1 hypothetical protein IPCEC48_45150 [Escherichia coli]